MTVTATGGVEVDISCLCVLILIFLSDLLTLISMCRFGGLPVEGYDWDSWRSLNRFYIQDSFESRGAWIQFDNFVSLFNSIAFLALFVPIFQVAWITSGGGKRRIGSHIRLFLLAITGGICELLATLMMTGARGASHWIADYFELDNWGISENNTDSIGWRVLEISYVMSTSLSLWITTFEWSCLFGIFTILYLEVNEEHIRLKGTGKTFSKSWATLGLIIGFLGMIEFFAELLSQRPGTWTIVTRLVTISAKWILIPLWLVQLGSQLPQIRTSFETSDFIPIDQSSIEMSDSAVLE